VEQLAGCLSDSLVTWAVAVAVVSKVVVEVAFNNVQDSPKYKSGMALRFARIVRVRPDKTAEQADTIQTMQRLQRQGGAASDTKED